MKYIPFKPTAVALCVTLAIANASYAQGDSAPVYELQAVEARDEGDTFGKTELTETEIAMAPVTNNNVTELLRGESFVQFDANSRSGATGGEITPSQISIRGSRHYENNFMINGVSNNSTLAPSGWDSTQAYGSVPTGDAQAINISTDLLESVTVLSENVSAEFGDFTGGVVNAKIRDARTDGWHGRIWTRHTRDSWARQHWIEGSEAAENDTPSSQDGLQKEFKRTTLGATVEGGLDDGRLGVMLSVERTKSKIPVWSSYGTLKEKKDSSRQQDNMMLKINTDPSNDFYASATLNYTPYEADVVAGTIKDGEFSLEGGGIGVIFNTRLRTQHGEWKNDLGWSKTEVSRYADSNANYTWLTRPNNRQSDYVTWSNNKNAFEGLMGDYEQKQQALTLKSVFAAYPTEWLVGTHTLKVGGEYQYVRAAMQDEGYSTFYSPKASNTVQGSLKNGVVAGEQYAVYKSVQDPYGKTADYQSVALFAEDEIRIERFTVRPGVRVSYDDLVKDINIAPRFTVNADVLNDQRFVLGAGYNRYYGSQVLAQSLRARTSVERYSRTLGANGELSDWKYLSGGGDVDFNENVKDLKTPHTDELVLSASANVLGGTKVTLMGVKRDYRDQLRTKSVDAKSSYYLLTNDGRSDYKGLTLTIDRGFDLGSWGRHHASFGVTRSDLKGNSTNWTSSWNEITDNGIINPDFAIVDGQKVAMDSMEANNFNSDWVITYTHNAYFLNDRLRSTVWLRWESAADRLIKDGLQTDNGIRYQKYKTHKNKALFNIDLSLQYDFYRHGDVTVTGSLEVLNLFDHKNLVNTSTNASDTGTYCMGRQFFAGLEARF